jgi:NCAIR mutase (PurE)-related protein
MKAILDAYKAGAIDEKEAQERILRLFYDYGEDFILDHHRQERLGFPEVIFAEGKSVDQVIEIGKRILAKAAMVLISNLNRQQESALQQTFSGRRIETAGRFMAIGEKAPQRLGTVGIVTAGTSDIPYANESALILDFMGAFVLASYDAGVAGIHRPFLSLTDVREAEVIIVLAGMEGALPTLIASITDKPIIAVPTPIGYGVGGGGIGAMISMFQTCAPGVVVVNIGNTVGASAAAIRILRSIGKNG